MFGSLSLTGWGGPTRSCKKVAEEFDIPRSSFYHAVKGRRTTVEYHHTLETLSKAESLQIRQWIKGSAFRGFPPNLQLVCNCIDQLLAWRGAPPVGKQVINWFMEKHPDIQKYTSSGLKNIHAISRSPGLIQIYYDALEISVVKGANKISSCQHY